MNRTLASLQQDAWPPWARVRRPLLWMVIILLAAAVLRVYGLNNFSPPGLEHDEVANWLIDRSILDGRLAIYFQEAYGHEAGFHYLQAAFVALLGDHALALRLPAAMLGMLVVAVQFALTRRLFGPTTALWSAAILAVLFWPIFYSRLGLRAISLPFICGLSLYAWWQAWPLRGEATRTHAASWLALSGLLAGLSLYTYMAARAVPIFFALFTLYLLLFHRQEVRRNRRGLLFFWVALGLSALPLVWYLSANPGAEFRISEVDAPLRALLAGDLRPVLVNVTKIAAMFGVAGDPLWRQNVAGRPVFGPILAFFFYLGVLLALLRSRDPRYAFLLLWLAISAVPSLVTTDAPSSIRMINALLVVTVFPVLVINMIARLSPQTGRLSTKIPYLLGIALLMAHIWWSVSGLFGLWPQNEEVQFVWQAALTDMAEYLDDSTETSAVAIGGWSPGTMDPPTMYLSMRRRDLPLRFFGSDSQSAPISTIILPGWGQAIASGALETAASLRLLRPAIRELGPAIEEQLRQWSDGPLTMDSFVRYAISQPELPAVSVTSDATFAEQLELIGYLPLNEATCGVDGCRILTYWHILAPTAEPRRFFLHLIGRNEQLLSQHDGLDVPVQQWQAGDLLVQEHWLPPVASGEEITALRLGVYDPQSGRRLRLPDGRDYLTLR